ncbi:hypothetical protein LB504_006632 [Fusarium proliferatum]|nr:hypothetical protein LB504_006632 [Fusarium proliferatum]
MPPQPTFLKMNESVRYRTQLIILEDDEFEHGKNTFHYPVCTSSVGRRQAHT